VIKIVMIVTVLMYTISLNIRLPSCVTIHNQCLNTELVSPVHFCNGAVCPKLSDQKIDISTKMKACFGINTIQDEFECALLFKLRRYSNRQHDMNTLPAKASKRETDCVRLLIVYKVKDSKVLLHVALIKNDENFTWDEEKLKKLYDKNRSWLKEYDNTMSYKWFVDDNMILETTFGARDLERIFEINISISEEEKEGYIMRPLDVDLGR
jgi:hypothetical protein